MCGFLAIVGRPVERPTLQAAVDQLAHRGPDADGLWQNSDGLCHFGHRRLSVLDLSQAGRQPMSSGDGRYTIVFNGEIYNYLELRRDLRHVADFHTGTDTEVLLAAYQQWGEACLDKLLGMFAFAIWDEREQTLFAARDRFGVKPLMLHEPSDGGLMLASEIKALHAAGAPRRPNAATWATYLSVGLYDHSCETFWEGIRQVPPGGCLRWTPDGETILRQWYDVAESVAEQCPDTRESADVGEELLHLLEESVKLRFRSDVPVGLCLSGGLDSSLLLALVDRVHANNGASHLSTFTYDCGDARYDETPWVQELLADSGHKSFLCRLQMDQVPELAQRVQRYQDEPFGGLPTLGMAMVHERAREEGVTVLLDGNGLDEGWAGYDYYARAACVDAARGPVQGSRSPSSRPDCLQPEFAELARQFCPPQRFGDALRNLQYRDIRHAKIPRAMRFADRVSMMYSRELREPFLDHRIIELGLRQPDDRKIRGGEGKWLPRRMAAELLSDRLRLAPKRPVQTPQREWLRGPLSNWAEQCIEAAIGDWGRDWLDARATRAAWHEFRQGAGDNSFPVWQWISLGIMGRQA